MAKATTKERHKAKKGGCRIRKVYGENTRFGDKILIGRVYAELGEEKRGGMGCSKEFQVL
jgi:hypothetical protein